MSTTDHHKCRRCGGAGWVHTAMDYKTCFLCNGNGYTTQAERDDRRLRGEIDAEAHRVHQAGPAEYRNNQGVAAMIRCYLEAIAGLYPADAIKGDTDRLAAEYDLPALPKEAAR